VVVGGVVFVLPQHPHYPIPNPQSQIPINIYNYLNLY